MSTTQAQQPQPPLARRWRFAWCEYLERSRELLVNGDVVKLETKPLDLLRHMLQEPAKIHTKPGLRTAVWEDTTTSDQSIATAISKLRKAFGGERDDIILNVSGTGYRMAVPVTVTEDRTEDPPPFHLQAGDTIPNRPNWRALRPLSLVTSSHTPMVWLAEHVKTHEARVFKFAVDGVALHALQKEVSVSRSLHESLPGDTRFLRILDWDLENSPYFIETEYSGPNLFEWSQDPAESSGFKAMSQAQRVHLVAEVAEAVAGAHSLTILHNDLKPSNILVMPPPLQSSKGDSSESDSFGDNWRIKIADFGVATISQPERIRELQITVPVPDPGNGEADPKSSRSSVSGTAMYRAPEQYAGAAPSIPGDVYALGVILYQVVCGDLLASLAPGWESKIDDPLLRQDIADAANVDPKLRIQTAAELAQRLRTIDSRRIEAQRQSEALALAQLAQKTLADARLRRPWIALTIATLSIGLCASLFFFIRAARARDFAEKQNATNTALFHFLADDLLGQSNPFLKGAAPNQPAQLTLVQAIERAIPQIDRRFQAQPEIAGQLHEEIGRALIARTEYAAAEKEFAIAAERFRSAEGPLSQRAIIAEFRRENAQLKLHTPSAINRANALLAQQQALVARLPHKTPELEAWIANGEADSAMSGPHPETALPLLNEAIRKAEKVPGFDPQMINSLKTGLGLLYEHSNDQPNAERVFREIIADVTALEGPDSRSLFQPEMGLDQALYFQNKLEEAKERTDHDSQQFLKALGPQNQLTVAALYMHAATESALGDNKSAVRDFLALYDSERSNPSGKFLQENSLWTAASIECHMGRFDSGIEHATQAVKESSAEPAPEPLFVNTSKFTIAECLISQQEATGRRASAKALNAAESLLKSVDVALVTHSPGLSQFEGAMDVAEARLALLRGDSEAARNYAVKAAPFAQRPVTDPYEKEALTRVEKALAKHPA